jgi:hypothetical protein
VGIRETLNKNQTLTTGATIAIIVIAIGVIVWQMLPERAPRIVTKSYYTVDDGKTWFEDAADKIAPFDKDGKEAVRAHLFKCGEDGEKFVGYLEKLDQKVKARVDEFKGNPSNRGRVMPGQAEVEDNGRLVKRPMDKNWIPETNPLAARITTIKCKDGSYAIRVTPEMQQQ